MREKDLARFQRAVDASMIIALAKLLLFNKSWEFLKPHLEKNGAKEQENLRIVLRERINSLPDDLFFIPPEEAYSEERVKEYFLEKFSGKGLQKLIAELTSRTRSTDPELSSYMSQANAVRRYADN